MTGIESQKMTVFVVRTQRYIDAQNKLNINREHRFQRFIILLT